MTTYTMQLTTGYPVPRYRTFEPAYDPVPIVRRPPVLKVDKVGADHGDEPWRNFETYLNQQQGTLTAHRSEKGLAFDTATHIAENSAPISQLPLRRMTSGGPPLRCACLLSPNLRLREGKRTRST